MTAKLGEREKKILLAMLELGNRSSQFGKMWGQILKKVGVDYEDYSYPVTKNKQQENFMEERKNKKSMTRLTKIELVRVVVPEGGKINVHRYGYQIFNLTEEGRKVAEELKDRENVKESEKAVEHDVEMLKAQGYEHASFSQIRELLWRLAHDKFSNDRKEFERYWNKTRLGKALRELGAELKRKRTGKGRVYRYCLKRAIVGHKTSHSV